MKKQFVTIFLIVSNILWIKDIKSQCSNYNTFNAMDTYWHYRYRLINYFMQVGEGTWDENIPQGGFGQSIPAYTRNFPNDNNECSSNPPYSCANGNQIWWSDVGRNLGYYIGTLASEYYLLYNNGQNTNQTVMELYYAIHAAFRLDSIGLIMWVRMGNTIDPSIIPNVQEANPIINFPGYGYMAQDDVPIDFYNNVGTVTALSNYGGYCQTGSGIVGPVNFVNSGCDFVFDKGYELMPLNELEQYLQLNHHLPG